MLLHRKARMLSSHHTDKCQATSITVLLMMCRTFCFFTIVYYWHIGKDKSAANVPNIAGFAFMW